MIGLSPVFYAVVLLTVCKKNAWAGISDFAPIVSKLFPSRKILRHALLFIAVPWWAFPCTIHAQQVPVPAAGCYLSAYLEEDQKAFEQMVGKKLAIGMFYVDMNTPDFPKATCDAFTANGTVPHLSWEPFGENNSNQAIIDGKRDEYIRHWARQVKQWGRPIFIRWGLEMNGDWYPWCGRQSGGKKLNGFGDVAKPDGPERFVAAYRRIHDLFKEEGASNVSWVFAPNITSEPDEGWNAIWNYYPGGDYVDWVALDGYNWGTTNGGTWKNFNETFKKPFDTLQVIAGDKPVMIAEFASTEKGGDKAAWIIDAFTTVKKGYPEIKAITWFDINKETDWRVNSSPSALEAYRRAAGDPYFLEAVEVK